MAPYLTASAANFAPHKALYDIKLEFVRSGAQVTNVQGQMMYEWHPDCDGWLATHKFDLHYDYADAPSMRVNSNFSTFESYNGQDMTFASKRARGGDVFEKLRGAAHLDENKKGAAIYTMPKDLRFDLPAGTLFPMGHTRAVFDAIQNDQSFLYSTIFDGSDDEGPVEVNTFIGAQKPRPAYLNSANNIDMTLLDDNPRLIRLAFFPKNKDSDDDNNIFGGAAEYEMDMLMHDNGVISQMVVEYESFTVRQNLKALEKTENLCPSH